MDSMNVTEAILDKKLDGCYNGNNFVASGEITVTITLNEYRELVQSNATKKYDVYKANNDKWEREAEIRRQKEENNKLREELCKWHSKFAAVDKCDDIEDGATKPEPKSAYPDF